MVFLAPPQTITACILGKAANPSEKYLPMTPETRARQQIDQKLEQAGWVIQDMKQLNLGAAVGVAVREYPTDTGPGVAVHYRSTV